jgi:hypothetical protein
MHPVISQAIRAERSREMELQAAAGQRAREIRRSRRARQARGPRPFLRVVARMAETRGGS